MHGMKGGEGMSRNSEYWIYQDRQVAQPWAIMLEVSNIEKGYDICACVYHESLDPCALVIADMRYSRCWRFAVRIALAMQGAGIPVIEADVVQLEECIGDVIMDFQRSVVYKAKAKGGSK